MIPWDRLYRANGVAIWQGDRQAVLHASYAAHGRHFHAAGCLIDLYLWTIDVQFEPEPTRRMAGWDHPYCPQILQDPITTIQLLGHYASHARFMPRHGSEQLDLPAEAEDRLYENPLPFFTLAILE